jgi:hypothetical protein
MIAINSDNLSVISDSEASLYSGRYIKVPGSAFAVLISRLGTVLIVQKRRTLAARKIIRFLIAAFSLILTASHSQARLGWTLAQFEQQYGQPVAQEQIAGRIGYVFTGEDYLIAAFFHDTLVSRILYIHHGGSMFDWGTAKALLMADAPDAIWDDASRNEADKSYRVNGTRNGVESYYASLTDDGQMLAIWTKEDDEAGRTKLDTPSVSSVVDSKSNGEETAGQAAPSSDREPTPEKTYPEAQANSSASSPTQRPTPALASRTKTGKVKLRSSRSRRETFHVATFEAKRRSKAFSPLPAGGQPQVPNPTPTPLLMNTGTGLYNSDNTQPFKNSKKAPGP